MNSDLADFIERCSESIIGEAVRFARAVEVGADLDTTTLRDHLPEVLQAIVADLRTEQSRQEGITKSKGEAPEPRGQPQTAAARHAVHRAGSGYSISGLVSEYRALRASVLRLWSDARGDTPGHLADITRFNEAIDEAIAESVKYYADEVERWRDVFLGVLGHELRNPLNAIVLSSEVICRRSADTPVARLAHHLQQSSQHMAKLLDRLLVYNRAQLGVGIYIEKSQVDLTEEVRREIEVLRASLPGADIRFEAGEAIQGLFDAGRLREVVSNLVVNAHKYGAPGSEIRVGLVARNAGAELAVRNHGEAIDAETAQRMFDPLRRGATSNESASERGSLGLGLFIVRQIALAHGGSIRCDSADGETTFTLELPDAC